MFPTPIQQRSRASQYSYQVFLPIALVLWLLPLIAVMIFSVKPDGDFVKGNFGGCRHPLSSSTTMGAYSLHPTCRNTC